MFFAFFLKLYSSSSYDKGLGIFAILRYMDLPLHSILIYLSTNYLLINSKLVPTANTGLVWKFFSLNSIAWFIRNAKDSILIRSKIMIAIPISNNNFMLLNQQHYPG